MSRTHPQGTADSHLSISSVSKLTGIEIHTLRYWEREFSEFLHPVRTPGGQRRYSSQDLRVIKTIQRLLRDEMFSIAGARKSLMAISNAA